MYLEACAMLPQIYMFQKQASSEGGVVEVSHSSASADGTNRHQVFILYFRPLLDTPSSHWASRESLNFASGWVRSRSFRIMLGHACQVTERILQNQSCAVLTF